MNGTDVENFGSSTTKHQNKEYDYESTLVDFKPNPRRMEAYKTYRLQQNLVVLINLKIKAPLVDGSQVAQLNHQWLKRKVPLPRV